MRVSVSERLQTILNERNLRQADLLEMIEPFCRASGVNIPRNALSQYVTGKVVPKAEKIIVLSMALGVSEQWLSGFDVPREIKPIEIDRDVMQNIEGGISIDEARLIYEYRKAGNIPDRLQIIRTAAMLSPKNQEKALDYMRMLLKIQQSEASE